MAKAPGKTYQLKVTLKGSKPPIWRRVLVPDTVTLAKLHQVLQFVMGWSDSHMHQFIEAGQYYGTANPDFDLMEVHDENKYRLGQLLKKEKQSLTYEYDFGDGWEHQLTLEKILPVDPKMTLPVCIKAKGACPPEDIGGLWGYYDFLEALNDPAHPEHDNYREWIDGEFDPLAYDMDEVNQMLAEYCR